MLEKLTNNFGWKILSIIFAFVLWLIVINYEDPLITREFKDLNVEKINENAITSQRKAIEYKEGESINIKVRGKRSIIDRLSANDIVATADMNKVSITGAVEIEVDVGEMVQIIEKKPTTMQIDLENIITVQKEVKYRYEGKPNEEYIVLEPIVKPNSIEITGPESKIASISNVVISVNVHNITKDVTLFASPQVQDINKKEVTGLTKSTNQVEVKVPVEKLKSIPISVKTSGNVLDGYKLTGINLNKDSITVKGKSNIIDDLNVITIGDISVQGRTSSFEKNIDIKQLLPQGVEIYEDDSTITIELNVEKIRRKVINIPYNTIDVEKSDDTKFTYLKNTYKEVALDGLKDDLENINIQTMKPKISIEDLKPGKHNVLLQLNIPYSVKLISDPFIEIELKELKELEEVKEEKVEKVEEEKEGQEVEEEKVEKEEE
jgi:YbbR domain-containing protein